MPNAGALSASGGRNVCSAIAADAPGPVGAWGTAVAKFTAQSVPRFSRVGYNWWKEAAWERRSLCLGSEIFSTRGG